MSARPARAPGEGGPAGRPRRGGERGGALLAMVLVTLTLVAVSVAYVSIVPVALKSTRNQAAKSHARYWALEAAARARLELLGGGDGNVDGNAIAKTISEPVDDDDEGGEGAIASVGQAPNGTFRARAVALPEPGTLLIESAAVMEGAPQRLAQVVRRSTRSPYRAALFAATAIERGTTTRLVTDSYDAGEGTYATQAVNTVTMPDGSSYTYARDRGTIAASEGDVAAPDGAVFGDAEPGVSGAFLPSPNTYVTGSTVPVAVAHRLEPFEYLEPATNNNADPAFAPLLSSNIYWGVFQPAATIPEGDYVVDHFVTLGQQVTVTGHVRIFVRGILYVLSASTITLAPGASLEIHMGGAGDALISGTGFVNTDQDPKDLRLYVAKGALGAPRVQISQTADLHATLYAPASRADVRTSRIRGALVADVIVLNSPTGTDQSVSYDESLDHLEDAAPRLTRYETLATWWLTR